MDWASIPVWVWVVLGVVVIIAAPLKLRILKSLLKKREPHQGAE